MKKRTASLMFSSLFGIGLVMAAPQTPAQANASAQADGQSAGQRRPDPNRQVRMLTKRLNLTDSQQSQILQILTERDQQMEAIRNDRSLSPQDRRQKMMALRQDTDAKVKATLDDNQKQSYDQLVQQMRDRARQHRQGKQDSPQNPGNSN
jgi:protein CpxP